MRRWPIHVFALVGGLSLCAIGQAAADPCIDDNNIAINDGKCWRTLTPQLKSGVIHGIWIGQRVQAAALEMRGGDGNVWFGVDWASVPEGTSLGDIIAYFDKLYETPANRKIEWHNAYLLAALMMRDDDENDRLSLLTFLRSNDEIPVAGTIAGLKSANVLQIESSGKTFDVRLQGIIVPESIRSKTEDFLRGLRFGAYFGRCERVMPTPVTLYYGTELFDQDGLLTADIRISSHVEICVNGTPIPLGEGNYSFTNVGHFLLMHGLAEHDPRVDPKWSDERKGRGDGDYSEAPREAQLYIFGEQTDPRVEVISGALPPDSY